MSYYAKIYAQVDTWTNERILSTRKDWEIILQIDADPTEPKEWCSGCRQLRSARLVCSSLSICNMCDDDIQPCLMNPKNKNFVESYAPRAFKLLYGDELINKFDNLTIIQR